MSFVDLNAPSAGELLSAEVPLRDGSKGAKNVAVSQAGKAGTRGRKGSMLRRKDTSVTPIEQAPKTKYEMRRNYMNLDRETWRSHVLDVKNNFLPYRTRWLDDGGIPNRGNKKMQYIVDNTPMIALRTMKAGLMSGMTSPGRPWFRLRPEDDAIYQKPGVAEWCENITNAMHRILAKSNFYRQAPVFYDEIGAFGTGAFGVYEVAHDPKRKHAPLINVQTYTWGEYWISQNDEGTVDTFVRKYKQTVRQIVMKFVDNPADPNDPGWDNLQPQTRSQWRNRQWETWIDIVQVIEPNDKYEAGAFGIKGMRTRVVYYELGGDPWTLLGVKGYADSPIKVARWDTNSDNVWGYGPAMYCLGDAKQLMVQQKRKMQGIDKQMEPPLMGDAALKRTTVSQLPGDITWLEGVTQNTIGLKPLYEVKPDLNAMIADILDTRKRIQSGMYTDIFQMMKTLGDTLKSGITATEIDARKQEQLLELGPLLDRLNGEAFEPMIDQIFDIAVRRSKVAWQFMARQMQVPPNVEMYFPPPPPALAGVKLQIQYISILARAVRMAEVQGINQTTAYVMQFVQVKPEVLDKWDVDKAIEIIADRTGTPPECIVSDEVVKKIRAQRQQQQQAAQAAQQKQEMMQTGADAASKLGNTPSAAGGSVLDQLTGQGGGGAPQQQAA
jgi:hypothetical protein